MNIDDSTQDLTIIPNDDLLQGFRSTCKFMEIASFHNDRNAYRELRLTAERIEREIKRRMEGGREC